MIYADYNSTAPLLPEVKEYLKQRLDTDLFANPNALHTQGKKVKAILEKSRSYCADYLDAHHDQVFFTSGATEALNWAIHSLLSLNNEKKMVISSSQEHPAVGKLLRMLHQSKEISLVELPSRGNGEIDSKKGVELLTKYQQEICFVTFIAASNETGVIQPLKSLCTLANELSIPVLADTTQLIGKAPFSFKNSLFDMAVMSGHKLGALPGSGILLCKNKEMLSPLIVGGGQERNLRAGTENYLGHETLSVALHEVEKHLLAYQDVQKLKDNFEQKIINQFPEAIILGKTAIRLPNTTYVSFPQIHAQALQIELEAEHIYVTTSAACSDNEPHTSISARAMGLSDEIGRGAIRLSFSPHTSEQDFSILFDKISQAVRKLKRLTIEG